MAQPRDGGLLATKNCSKPIIRLLLAKVDAQIMYLCTWLEGGVGMFKYYYESREICYRVPHEPW